MLIILTVLFARKTKMKKRLTVIPADKMICVDDVCITIPQDLPWLENNIHAIQWNEETQTGHVEYTDGTSNKSLSNISKYTSAIDIFNSIMIDYNK